jgi:hypothetical protein
MIRIKEVFFGLVKQTENTFFAALLCRKMVTEQEPDPRIRSVNTGF